MVYNSLTSPEFQHQANAGQMLMVPQQMTPPMYRFPQQQPQQQYVYVQQLNATPIQGVTPIQTQFAAQPVTPVTPVTPPAVPITPSNTEQNDETPPSSSEKNKSSSKKKIQDKKKDKGNETNKKAENNVSKDSGESKDKSPLAQKLPDDDNNIVYLKLCTSSYIARPEIQKLLSETQQNANEQSGSNATQSTGTTALDSNQQTVPNIQQPTVPNLPTQHQLPPLCNLQVQFNQFLLLPWLCLYNISSHTLFPLHHMWVQMTKSLHSLQEHSKSKIVLIPFHVQIVSDLQESIIGIVQPNV